MSKHCSCNKKIFNNVTIYPPVHIEPSAVIGEGTKIGEFSYVGKNVSIGEDCMIMQHVTICKNSIIGYSVFIGPNTSLLNDKYPPTHNPPIESAPKIGHNSIIGGGCVILPNVIIHHEAVVGAGSVVTKDVQPRTVVAGNPAKKIMNRKDYNLKQVFLK